MVEVQSSWFPLYNRNPQKFVPNILKASRAIPAGNADDLSISKYTRRTSMSTSSA
jgi:predicted acyl esterase